MDALLLTWIIFFCKIIIIDSCSLPNVPDGGFIYPPNLKKWEADQSLYILCRPGFISELEIQPLTCNLNGAIKGETTTCVENGLYGQTLKQGPVSYPNWSDGDTSTCHEIEAKKNISIEFDSNKQITDIRLLMKDDTIYDFTLEVWEKKDATNGSIAVCRHPFNRKIEYTQSIVFPCSLSASTKTRFLWITNNINSTFKICEIETALPPKPKPVSQVVLVSSIASFLTAVIALIIILYICKRHRMKKSSQIGYNGVNEDRVQNRKLPPEPPTELATRTNQRTASFAESLAEDHIYAYVRFPCQPLEPQLPSLQPADKPIPKNRIQYININSRNWSFKRSNSGRSPPQQYMDMSIRNAARRPVSNIYMYGNGGKKFATDSNPEVINHYIEMGCKKNFNGSVPNLYIDMKGGGESKRNNDKPGKEHYINVNMKPSLSVPDLYMNMHGKQMGNHNRDLIEKDRDDYINIKPNNSEGNSVSYANLKRELKCLQEISDTIM